MEWKLTREPLASLATDAIIVFHSQVRESTRGITREIDEALGFRISSLITAGEITGELGEVIQLHNWGKIPSDRVIVVGLGEETNIDLHRFKHAVAAASRQAMRKGLKSIGIGCPSFIIERYNSVDVAQAIVEGVELGTHQHQRYRTGEKKKQLESVSIPCATMNDSAVQAGIERGRIFARATNYARFLSHEPANLLTPQQFVDYAKQIAEKRGLEIEVLDEARLEELGMEALLSVARGSEAGARMIVISYYGAPESREILGFVGKGVTFDCGGLQVKSDEGMLGMKGDMAGAAAVLAAMDAIGELRPHSNVLAVIPVCENMINGRSYRPGDVLRSFSGKTIEITHTDAEGRLILAEGIAYAKRKGATRLVDVATLTEAVVVALGHEATGMMGNDEEWLSEVKTAARVAGEHMWELPMYPEFKTYLKSEIADIKNDGGRPAGCIQGAVFLQEFAEETPWVHLDISGTAIAPRESGIFVEGATGVGVRTLIQMAVRFG